MVELWGAQKVACLVALWAFWMADSWAGPKEYLMGWMMEPMMVVLMAHWWAAWRVESLVELMVVWKVEL